MLRCSAATAVALPHLPVSFACFGSGLFNELEKTHDELETGREGRRGRENDKGKLKGNQRGRKEEKDGEGGRDGGRYGGREGWEGGRQGTQE